MLNNNLYGGTRLLEGGISIDTSHGFNTNNALVVSHSAVKARSNPNPTFPFSTATGIVNFVKSGNTLGDPLTAPRLKGTTVARIPRKSKFFALAANVPVGGNSSGPVYMVPSFDTNNLGGLPAGNIAPTQPLTDSGSGLGLRGSGLSSLMNPPTANGVPSDTLISYDQIRAKTGSLVTGDYNGTPTVYDSNIGFDRHAATVQNGGPGLNYAVGKGNIITSVSEATSGLVGENLNETIHRGHCARNSGTCWALLNDNLGEKVNLNENPDSTFAGLSPLKTPPGQVLIDYSLPAITVTTNPVQSTTVGVASSSKMTLTSDFVVEALTLLPTVSGFEVGGVYPVKTSGFPVAGFPWVQAPGGIGLKILVTEVFAGGTIKKFEIKDQGRGYTVGQNVFFTSPGTNVNQFARITKVTNGDVLSRGEDWSGTAPAGPTIGESPSDLTEEPAPKYTGEGSLRARMGQTNGPTPEHPRGAPAIVTGYASLASSAQPQGQPVQPASRVGPGVETPIFTISAGNGNLSHSLKVQADIDTSFLVNSSLAL